MQIRTNVKAGTEYQGSFTGSCENILQYPSFDDMYTEISGTCRRANGARNYTSISVPLDFHGDISNCDGQLTLGGCV
jgi:hypothetical protein